MRALALLALLLVTPARADPLGLAPQIVRRDLADVPNASAIRARLWVPGLDEGFVPQGLAFQGGRLALAGYVSTDRRQSKGPCRLVWLDPASGRVEDVLDLPPACGHAGGAAALADGRLVVADTHALFVVRPGAPVRTLTLRPPLLGSFADADATHLWIGAYDKAGGRLWRLALAALDKSEIEEADAVETRAAPPETQGLAFDRQGGMWASVSGSRHGAILRLGPAGETLARYAAPPGIEDIAFAPDGTLWASSEAGSRRWSDWPTFFPLVFSIDVTALR